MNKFFVYTRGRTGSTAIVDELDSHPHCVCHGEVFRRDPLKNPKVREAYDRLGLEYLKERLTNDKVVIPFGLWEMIDTGNRGNYRGYLEFVQDEAARKDKTAVGFKLLHNQSVEREGLLDVLKSGGFVAIHLIRRNVVRQVLSGMLAKQRGVYNRRNYDVPDEKYDIDVAELVRTIERNQKDVAAVDKQLRDGGFDYFSVYYEDFLAQRDSFFDLVLSRLNLAREQLKASDWTIMVPSDLRKVVNNYEEMEAAVVRIGLADMLTSQ